MDTEDANILIANMLNANMLMDNILPVDPLGGFRVDWLMDHHCHLVDQLGYCIESSRCFEAQTRTRRSVINRNLY